MPEDPLVAIAVVTGTIALFHALWERHSERDRRGALVVVLQTALLDAARRRHAMVTPEHLLWVLLDVPEVASAWEARGWPLAEFRTALDERLGGSNEIRGPETMVRLSPDLSSALGAASRHAAARREAPGEKGRAMLAALLRELLTREASAPGSFIARGPLPPYDTFSLGAPAREEPMHPSPPAAPYRSAVVVPSANVIFWNDQQTSMVVVVEILTRVFGMSETRATYLMLTVHHRGRAVVWSSGRAEAESLSTRATSSARTRNMPLRVTVEDAR